MKKIGIFLFILFTVKGFSQIQKGTEVAGSSVGVNFTQTQDTFQKYYRYGITFAPNFGIAVAKNLVVGGILSYNYSKDKRDYHTRLYQNYSNVYNNFGASFFVKKYFLRSKFGGVINWNTGFNVALTSRNQDNYYSPHNQIHSAYHQYSFSTTISPGLVYFFSEKWALEIQYGSIGYSMNYMPNQKYASKSMTNSFSANFNPSSLFFNLRYYFPKKEKANLPK